MFKTLRFILAAATLLIVAAQPAKAQTTTGRFGRIVLNSACVVRTGTGSPESAVTGNVCDLYLRTNGGSATTLYVKESGTGNTGWAAVGSGGGGAPTTATYITQTADAGLSAEQALGALATGLMNNTTTTGVVSTIAPTDDNVVVGSGSAWQLKPLTDCAAAGNAVTYSTATNAFGCNTISGGGSNTLLDGTNHTDTTAGTVVRGDLIVGDATPKWARFAKCASGTFIKYDANGPACNDLLAGQQFSGDLGTNNTFPHVYVRRSNSSTSPAGGFQWWTSDGTCRAGIELQATIGDGFEFNGGTTCATILMFLDRTKGFLRFPAVSGATPSIASGFGTSPAIEGSGVSGRVTVGTGGTAATGVINFNLTWTSAPSCMAQNATTVQLVQATSTTTTLTLTSSAAWTAADKLYWHCIGY